jgi:hypothetical protein
MTETERFDERPKFNRARADAASKVCEIFHDFGAVNVVNKFYCFWLPGQTPHFRLPPNAIFPSEMAVNTLFHRTHFRVIH